MELHLFSTPGGSDERDWVLEAGRGILENKTDPLVVCLPLGALSAGGLLEQTRRAFAGLARVELLDAETMELAAMQALLRRAALVYIPGGNAFLLNHRLHISRLLPYLRKKAQGGLPVLAFGAGAVLCGPNILSAQDMNAVESPYVAGLDLMPFNLLVDYAQDALLRAWQDRWLAEYHVFHDNPVLILAEGAYVRLEGRKTWLVRGEAWVLRKGREAEKVELAVPLAA